MAKTAKPSVIVAACVGTLVTGMVAYAAYFDHRRRTDPEFRKSLKRDSRKQARAAKEEAEAEGVKQRRAIRQAVDNANEEGFPKSPEEGEAYFMQEVGRGEGLCPDGIALCGLFNNLITDASSVDSKRVEAALCFYKALKVYPAQRDLINIYDKTVPKVCDATFALALTWLAYKICRSRCLTSLPK